MMNYFLLNKYQPVEESILYSSKVLYELLQSRKHIDELFDEYSSNHKIPLSVNLERTLYLSLTFLFSIGKIKYDNNLIMRV